MRVKANEKPLIRAGMLPPDHPVAFRLAGQLNGRMMIDPDFTAAAAPPELRRKIYDVLSAQLSELLREELIVATTCKNWKLTRRGRFYCYSIAARLMEEIAKCWE